MVEGEAQAPYMSKAKSGEWRAVTGNWRPRPVSIAFPSAMALSHMWLDNPPRPQRPQPAGNVAARDRVALPERVKQLGGEYAAEDKYGCTPKDADGTPPSDEAILAAADFGLFVDLSSMCQKENDRRTEVEDGLFRHSLGSLDVVYAQF